MSRVRDLAALMHLGLINWPFVPHVQSREPRSITEAPDGPQAYTLNILRLQEEGAHMCMSEWGQSLTFTKNMGQGFLLHHSTYLLQVVVFLDVFAKLRKTTTSFVMSVRPSHGTSRFPREGFSWIQVRSKDSQVKTQLVLWMFILFKVTTWQHVSASITRPPSGHK
jgi:hypothetical protein